MMRHGSCQAFVVVAFVSVASFARAERPLEIFDKTKRVLESPKKNIDSKNPNVAARVESEKARGLSAELETVEVTPSLSVQEFIERRSAIRSEKLSRAAFSGERTFGIGFMGAGAFGVFGTQFDFAAGDAMSIGFGIGTGMAYSSWGAHARVYLAEGRVTSFFEGGYAQWHLGKVPSNLSASGNYLMDRFFSRDGVIGANQTAHLLYPSLGLLFQHASGLAALAQIQYLIHVRDFSGGLFAGGGLFYYF